MAFVAGYVDRHALVGEYCVVQVAGCAVGYLYFIEIHVLCVSHRILPVVVATGAV